MQTLIVVDKPRNWPFAISGVEVVSARDYLSGERYGEARGAKVFNLCKSYRYQTIGYYVSLLAEARGHKPIPRISAIQDMKSQTMMRFTSGELDELIQKSLAPIQSSRFTLSVYFGRNVAKRYDRLSAKLFGAFHVPFMRAQFGKGRKWALQSVNTIAAEDIPEEHRDFVIESAQEFFARRTASAPRRRSTRFDIAILVNPEDPTPPSDEPAIKKFIRAAGHVGLGVEVITKEDYGRVAEFDALFIRETTSVNHHTFRFARRAAAEGLVVIDDPESILKCANKVFLAELLRKKKIPTPGTMIVHKDNMDKVSSALGFPCILKTPDSSFSQGVIKVDNEVELKEKAEELLKGSELIIAQSYLPTEYDWRVGVLGKRPLYVCKYYMAEGHWQIINHTVVGPAREGNAEGTPVSEAPEKVVKMGVKAASLIGDGLYGVDLKQSGGKVYVIEVNDNPNIEAGYEDAALKDGLYLAVMTHFLKKIEQKKVARAL